MNAWLVRPNPHGKNRIKEFRSQDIVAIGWPETGSLAGLSREDLKTFLAGPPYNLSGLKLGNAYATVDIFINQIAVGDTILSPDGDDIYFAEIIGDYQFEEAADAEGYSHQRKVRWLSTTSRKELSKELRTSLKVHRATANLSHHAVEIRALAAGNPVPLHARTVEISYPLRPDFSVEFEIPADISKNEAERLSKYFHTLYFTE